MTDTDILWQYEDPIETYDTEGEIDLPAWLEEDISPADVAAIVQGGCDSGAYMPAVTYHSALQTMSQYGDAIWDYIEEATGEHPLAPITAPSTVPTSWAGLACCFVSAAVELWAQGVEGALADLLEEIEEEEDPLTPDPAEIVGMIL